MEILKLLNEEISQTNLDTAHKAGYNINDVLYHGTDQVFNKFDRKFSKSARHIYTTPDPLTASNYGKFVYIVAPKIKKLADLIDDYDLIQKIAIEFNDAKYDDLKFSYKTPDDILNDHTLHLSNADKNKIDNLIDQYNKVRDEFVDQGNDEYEFSYEDIHDELMEKMVRILAVNEMCELLQSSKIYDYDMGRLQDNIMDWCYSEGYNVVRMFDYSSHGENISYVFDDPNDLFIIGTED